MKKVIVAALLLVVGLFSVATTAAAKTISVKGYFKSNGTYVAPYFRTSPNTIRFDNYSAKGNYNPFTGKQGTVRW